MALLFYQKCVRKVTVQRTQKFSVFSFYQQNPVKLIPYQKSNRHRFLMKLGMLLLQDKEILKHSKKRRSPCLLSRHNADNYGYSGDFWWSPCATNKLVYFSAQRVIWQSYMTSFDWLFICAPEKNVFRYPALFLFFKGNIIWTCAVRPIISLCIVYISFAKKVAIVFSHHFLLLRMRILFLFKLWYNIVLI